MEAAQLCAAPDANRRAAVFRELYYFASPVRAGELGSVGPHRERKRAEAVICSIKCPVCLALG